MLSRLRPMAAELFKFVVVGGFCFILDTLLANWFHFGLGLGPTTSKTLSTVIATGVSYVGNRLWSFAHRVEDDRGHGQDVTVYAAINVVGLVITLIPVDVAHYVLSETSKLAFNISQVLGTLVATVFRFWAYRRWVFAADPDAAERAALV
ncbi:MAG: GtrA family protein [Mycobacteriales bacterium]